MILTVSGWRNWTDPKFVLTQLEGHDDMFGLSNINLRVGCCPTGVDKVVRSWGAVNRRRLASFTVYYADWDQFGRAAGPIRNGDMLHGRSDRDPFPGVKADRLLAFPQPGVEWWVVKSGSRSGTGDCIKQASKAGIHLDIPGYYVSTEERA